VRRDEVDGRERPATVDLVQVRRAGEARSQLAQSARLATPEVAYGIAVFAVPLRPQGREAADLIATRTNIPRLADQLILAQDGVLADLLPPRYWLDLLHARGMHRPGTVLLSGTVAMIEGVDQFAEHWQVELSDEVTGRSISHGYDVRTMADPIE